MQWASRSGIDVPECRLASDEEFVDLPAGAPVGDGTVFLIRRFDRVGEGGRVHIEDFAQVLDRPGIYDQPAEFIAAVLARIAPSDVRAYCERLVFCVLSGNGDAHLKNWSIHYPDRRRASLSPAYDLVSTVLRLPRDRLALSIGGSQGFGDIRTNSFERLASVVDVDFGEASAWIGSAAERVREVWASQQADFSFTREERARLDMHQHKIPLGR